MTKPHVKGVVILLAAAFIWGATFVAQSVSTENIGAFTFNSLRSLLGALVLVPVILFRERRTRREQHAPQDARGLFLAGAKIGLAFAVASNFQQFAFYESTAGKIAFITALYMFFVPIFGLLLGKKSPAVTWLSAALAFGGLYLLSFSGVGIGGVNRGDLLALINAVCYAVQILLVDKYVKRYDGVKLASVEFLTAGLLSGLLMLLFEQPSLHAVRAAAVPILYAGIMSCGVAFTFQIIGQKTVDAPLASLLMCMESVFAVISAAVVLHERMTGREILGCAVMFAAILLSQLWQMRHADKGA